MYCRLFCMVLLGLVALCYNVSSTSSTNQGSAVETRLHESFLAILEHPRILMSKSADQLNKDFQSALESSRNITNVFLRNLYQIGAAEADDIVSDLYADLESFLNGEEQQDVIESVELFFDRLFSLIYRYVLTESKLESPESAQKGTSSEKREKPIWNKREYERDKSDSSITGGNAEDMGTAVDAMHRLNPTRDFIKRLGAREALTLEGNKEKEESVGKKSSMNGRRSRIVNTESDRSSVRHTSGHIGGLDDKCLMEARRDLIPRTFGDAPLRIGANLKKSLQAARDLLVSLRVGASVINATSHLSVRCGRVARSVRDKADCEERLSSDALCLQEVGGAVSEEWEELINRLTGRIKLMTHKYNLIDTLFTMPAKISQAIAHCKKIAHKFHQKVLSLCYNESTSSRGHHVREQVNKPSTNQAPPSAAGSSLRIAAGEEGLQLYEENRERLLQLLTAVTGRRGLYSQLGGMVCELYEQSMENSRSHSSSRGHTVGQSHPVTGHRSYESKTADVLLKILQQPPSITSDINSRRSARHVEVEKRQGNDLHGNHLHDNEVEEYTQGDEGSGYHDDYEEEGEDYPHGSDDEYVDYERGDGEASGGSGEEEGEVEEHKETQNKVQKPGSEFVFDPTDSSHIRVNQPGNPVTQSSKGGVSGSDRLRLLFVDFCFLSFLYLILHSIQWY